MAVPAYSAHPDQNMLLYRDAVAAYVHTTVDRANWKEHKRVCKALKTLETRHAEELLAPFRMFSAFSGQGVGLPELTDHCANSVARVEMRVLVDYLGRLLSHPERILVGWQPRCLACGRSDLILRVEASSGGKTKPSALKACPDCRLAFACNDAHWAAVKSKHKTLPCEGSVANKTHCEMNQMMSQDLCFAQVLMGVKPRLSPWVPARTMEEWASLKDADWSDYEPLVQEEFGNGTVADKMLVSLLRLSTQGLSMPLTALWALETLNEEDISWTKKEILNIHILGAAKKEALEGVVFEEILHRLPEVKTLNLFFVGPELADFTGTDSSIKSMKNCDDCLQRGRKRVHHYHPKLYHIFVNEAGYANPDLAVAFNSGCAEMESVSWKETLEVLVDRHIPTAFTSYNRDEAYADSRMLADAGATLVPELGPRENPWGSWASQMHPNTVTAFGANNGWLAGGFR